MSNTPLITNKELVQSYLVTTARYDFSVYEKRILYRITEALQHKLEGKKLNASFQRTIEGTSTVTIAMKYFLNGEEDKNHARIKKALNDLNSKRFEYNNGEIWKIIRLIEMPKIVFKSDTVTFTIHDEIQEALLNFAKGFRILELKTAFELESVYAMRFYELFSKQQKPISYTIDTLKEMFLIADKYKGRPSDFIKYVVEAAKRELDEKSPYSFDYTAIKLGRKINSIRFKPKYITKNEDRELQKKKLMKQSSTAWILNSAIKTTIKDQLDFSEKEIKNNLLLFEEASRSFKTTYEFHAFVVVKAGQSRTKKPSPKGWFINALKGEISNRR